MNNSNLLRIFTAGLTLFFWIVLLHTIPAEAQATHSLNGIDNGTLQNTPPGFQGAYELLGIYLQTSDPDEEAKRLRQAVISEFASNYGWHDVNIAGSASEVKKVDEHCYDPDYKTEYPITEWVTITDRVDDDGFVSDEEPFLIEQDIGLGFRSVGFYGLPNGYLQTEEVDVFKWREGAFDYEVHVSSICYEVEGYEDEITGRALEYAQAIYDIAHRYGLHTWTPGDIYGEVEQTQDEETPQVEDKPTPRADCMDGSCEEAFCEGDTSVVTQYGILDEDAGVCHVNSIQMSSFDCGQQSSGDEYYYGCDYSIHECIYGYALACPGGCNPETGRCIGGAPLEEDDLCAGVVCEDPVCSPDNTQSWSGISCNPDTGLCDQINQIIPCAQYCEEDFGICVEDAFAQACAELIASECQPYCDGNTRYYAEDCNDEGCIWSYQECSENCYNGRCISTSSGGDFEDILGVLGILGGIAIGGGGLLGGGYFGYKALRTRLGRRKVTIPKAPEQPVQSPAKPDQSLMTFDNLKRLLDYPNKIMGVLDRYKFAPDAKEKWLVARNLWNQFPSEHSAQKYIDASRHRMNPTGKVGKYLDRAGKLVDAVDAVIKAEKVIKKRGYKGWEKAGAYFVEGANKFITTVLTKNPVVTVVDQVAGDLTGHNIENTIRAGEEKWHKVTEEYYQNTFQVDAKDAEITTKKQGMRYIRNIRKLMNEGKISRGEGRRRARAIFDKMVR